jgi:predicted RNA-binding protein with RPS1 domain
MTNGEQTTVAHAVADLKPKSAVQGKVTRIELYGAFVDVGVGQDGLLHISQISTERVKNVNDKLSVGDEIKVWVRSVDAEQNRIDLTMIEPPVVDWDDLQVGTVLTGKVIRLEKFGVFVDLGAERPGMVHVSELSNNYINSPADVVKVGQEIQVKVIKVSSKKKQIDLSVKALEEKIEIPKNLNEDVDFGRMPTAMELAIRGAMQGTDMAAQLPEPRKKAESKNEKAERLRKQQAELLTRTLQNRPK